MAMPPGIMFCEMAAYAKSRGRTVDQLLDEAFAGFGYFEEKNGSLYFEGAEGADKIARLLESYARKPPGEIAGSKVVGVTDFEKQTIRDVEGDVIPKQKMSDLRVRGQNANCGARFRNRTKNQVLQFSPNARPEKGKFAVEQLSQIKSDIGRRLEEVWNWVEKDARTRVAQ